MSEPRDLSLIERRNAMGVRYHGDTVVMLDIIRQQQAVLEDAAHCARFHSEEHLLRRIEAVLDLSTEGRSHDQRNEPRQDTSTD